MTPPIPALSSERLILRGWRDEDLPVFARLNADRRVMEFMPSVLTREESDATVARISRDFAGHGFGLWAIERRDSGEFIGFTGLSVPGFRAPFTPCVEIGWRLAAGHWGRGFATEAARAALACGFGQNGLMEIVSFTAVANTRSRRVMERLGMQREPADDFDHPKLEAGHPLRRHILHRIRRDRSA